MENNHNTNIQTHYNTNTKELHFQAISLIKFVIDDNIKFREENALLSLTNKENYNESCPCTFHIEKCKNIRAKLSMRSHFRPVRCTCNKLIFVTFIGCKCCTCHCKLCSDNRK